MNSYIPPFYLPPLEVPHFQPSSSILKSNPLLPAYLGSLMANASGSLNNKRQFIYDSTSYADDYDFSTSKSMKKVKLDTFNTNMHFQAQPSLSNQKIITIDDNGDNMGSVITNIRFTNGNFIAYDLPRFEHQKEYSINHRKLESFYNNFTTANPSSPNFIMDQIRLNSASLYQQLSYGDLNHDKSQNFSCSVPPHGQTNKFEPLSGNHKNSQKFSKLAKIVIIDDDDDDKSTSQGSEARNDASSPNLNSPELKEQKLIQSQICLLNKATDSNKVKANKIERHAKLPPFQLSLVKQQKRKIKPLKLVWNPDSIEENNTEGWMSRISQAVGIEVTNEEKVVKTLINFGMDIETALENVKRNKAFYKNYFRVKNAPRSY